MNGNTIYDLRHEHDKQARAARRGWPPMKDRPKCLGCDKKLAPDWKWHSRLAVDDPRGSETDELRGWESYGNVFCTMSCAVRYALNTPAARAVRAANTAKIDELNASHTPKFPADNP